jgi:hypothetical protein
VLSWLLPRLHSLSAEPGVAPALSIYPSRRREYEVLGLLLRLPPVMLLLLLLLLLARRTPTPSPAPGAIWHTP